MSNELAKPVTHDPPHPAYSFAFVIQETFTLSWGGVTVVSPPECSWHQPCVGIKVMLRTPDGELLESAASLVHSTPNPDSIISLKLPDLTKAEVPVGTELFVRMRRTPEELQQAFAALDDMMGSCWNSLNEFPEFPDAHDFRLWMQDQLIKGLAEEVPIKKPHRKNKSGEHWYKNIRTNQVWRYLETILPNRESFECISPVTDDQSVSI